MPSNARESFFVTCAPGLEPDDQLVRLASFVLPADADFRRHALDAVKYRKGEPHIAV